MLFKILQILFPQINLNIKFDNNFYLFIHICRKGRTENSGTVVLGKSFTDATFGNATGAGQAIGRDIGICIEV